MVVPPNVANRLLPYDFQSSSSRRLQGERTEQYRGRHDRSHATNVSNAFIACRLLHVCAVNTSVELESFAACPLTINAGVTSGIRDRWLRVIGVAAKPHRRPAVRPRACACSQAGT